MIFDTDRIRYDAEYRDELRHKCETDHFFLAPIMGFKQFHPVLHKPAVDLYFPKNRNVRIEDQHPIHFRMHLDPRGTFKTTLGRVDTMQWMLAFPERITILNETATQPLAKAVSEGVADYFYQPKGRGMTVLQMLYPELITDREPFSYGQERWNMVVREFDPSDIDSTLAYTSPLSTQSGWHPYLIQPDDMAETNNSGIGASEESRRKVIDKYDQNENLLRAGGYINIRGTRYHPFDMYGDILEKMDPAMWKILVRRTMTVNSGQQLLPGEFPAEDECVMHFAELPGMDYKTMRAKFMKNYESFMAQQQNDPQGGHVPVFDEKLYTSMLISPDRVPAIGETFLCWRFPYGAKKSMPQAEGVAARIWEGKVYILDAWAGTYTPSRLAEKVVRECKRWQTGMLVCEDVPGIGYMEANIRNEALRKNLSVKFNWLEFEEDDNARAERIKQIEPQARAGKILVSTGIAKLAEIKRQLCNFGLVRENGIVDAISQMARRIPMSLFRAEIDDDEAELQIKRRQAVMSHFVYGMDGGMNELEQRREQEQIAHMAAMERATSFGLTDVLGGLDG